MRRALALPTRESVERPKKQWIAMRWRISIPKWEAFTTNRVQLFYLVCTFSQRRLKQTKLMPNFTSIANEASGGSFVNVMRVIASNLYVFKTSKSLQETLRFRQPCPTSKDQLIMLATLIDYKTNDKSKDRENGMGNKRAKVTRGIQILSITSAKPQILITP
jgi:hypothetical protein